MAQQAPNFFRVPSEKVTPPSPLGATSAPPWDHTLANRKIELLKRAGLFGDDTKGATIERACTLQDLRDAYRLVHDVYLGTGYLYPEPSGLRLRIFETTSDTATFVAKKDGRVVGVLSVVGDSADLGLPSDSAFKMELDAERAAGVRLCELTNQVVSEEFRKSAVPTELMRCAIAHGITAGYNKAVAAVSPSHGGFYDLLGFSRLGGQRSYSKKLHDPVIAVTLDLEPYRQPASGLSATEQFRHDFAHGQNRFLARIADWTKEARRHFLNTELLEQLFVTERNFLAECSPAELKILQRRWGQEIFGAIAGNLNEKTGGGDAVAATPTTVAPNTAPFADAPAGLSGMEIVLRRSGPYRARSFRQGRRSTLKSSSRGAKALL